MLLNEFFIELFKHFAAFLLNFTLNQMEFVTRKKTIISKVRSWSQLEKKTLRKVKKILNNQTGSNNKAGYTTRHKSRAVGQGQ